MSDADLFALEHGILANARAVFEDPAAGEEGCRHTLGNLIGAYERLIRDTRQLIRRSDREEFEMNRLNYRLQELASELKFRVTHDALTGAISRGALVERAGEMLADGCVALVMLDIDHFKRVNDHHGHPAGDAVLRGVAACLIELVDGDGPVGRVGGEEFAVLLPGQSLLAATGLAERMRAHLASQCFAEVPDLLVTASFGVTWNAQHASFERAYARTDEALYEAKRLGRNRVVCAS
jgi:diguanylate cyclase (GGDEF)-like protein